MKINYSVKQYSKEPPKVGDIIVVTERYNVNYALKGMVCKLIRITPPRWFDVTNKEIKKHMGESGSTAVKVRLATPEEAATYED